MSSNRPSLDAMSGPRQPKTPKQNQSEVTQTPSQPTPIPDQSSGAVSDVKKTDKKKTRFWQRRWFLVSAGIFILVAVAGAASAYILLHPKPKPVREAVATPKPTPSATPPPIYDPLTGLPTTAAAAQSPVIGVMIENLYPQARPQSGLGTAGLVYEALAEGGITRFEAIFQEPLPSSLGPVRSLRPYFLDFGLEHNIPVVHAGGSQPAMAEIGPLGMKDINALRYDGSFFFRISSRYAPHNLYTNAQDLTQLDSNLGFATAPTFTPFSYKADQPMASPTHQEIDVTYSSAPYNVQWKYSKPSNSYARFMGGAPHVDANTNQQIGVKNVVVEFVATSYGTQADGDPMTIMQLVGSGKALVFNDGGMVTGTWSKASDAGQTQYLDATGKPMQFNRGNTWIDVVPTTAAVQY